MADQDNATDENTKRLYFARAAKEKPQPRRWAFLTILGPLLGIPLTLGLVSAINLTGAQSTAYAGLTHKTVRTAIHDVLTKDLHADRIQAVLLDAKDKPPAAPGKKKPTPEQLAAAATKRKTERTERLKPVATRMSGEVGRLSDALTIHALAQHLSEANAAAAKTLRAIQAAPKDVVARLDEATVTKHAKDWAAKTLDPHTTAAARDALADGVALDDTVVSLVDGANVQAAVERAVAPSLDPADVRPAAATWAEDIRGRLIWAIVALVFCLLLLAVLLNSGLQILTITKDQRKEFIAGTVVGLVVALAATLAALHCLPIMQGPASLHTPLQRYSALYGLALPTWSQALTLLTSVGGTALIAGALATLWVEVTKKEELVEQLRGFRSLFNAGAILLFFGVLEITALFRWPTLFIGDEAVRTAMQGAAATYAASVGALFSVLLLATYVPATAALRRQALMNGVSTDDVGDAMQKAGFGDLAFQQAVRLSQVFAPLLPGVVSLMLTASPS